MLSNFKLSSRHLDIMLCFSGSCLYLTETVYFFFCKQTIDLVGSFDLHSMRCVSNISSVFKTFSVSFESVPCGCIPLPSLGPEQSSFPKCKSQSCWHAV